MVAAAGADPPTPASAEAAASRRLYSSTKAELFQAVGDLSALHVKEVGHGYILFTSVNAS